MDPKECFSDLNPNNQILRTYKVPNQNTTIG